MSDSLCGSQSDIGTAIRAWFRVFRADRACFVTVCRHDDDTLGPTRPGRRQANRSIVWCGRAAVEAALRYAAIAVPGSVSSTGVCALR